MNFKRIQWIFFFAFLLFDVIIASSILVENRFIVTNNQSGRSSVVLKEMKDDSISYGKLASGHQNGYYLSGYRSTEDGELDNAAVRLHGQETHFSNNTLTSEFSEPLSINIETPNVRLNELIHNTHQVALGKHYRYNPYLSTKRVIIYTQMVEGRSVMNGDGQIRFRVNSNHEVTGYTQTFLEGVKILRPESSTISQKRAVVWLYKHNQIPNNSRIRWVQLGYSRLLSTNTDNRNVYIPTWVAEIKTKNSGAVDRISINAFNSTIMKDITTSVNTEALNRK
ncbi:two-component system regulatory protein YycI [Limosilactobacillus agrestimuris]|uniref:two-component system regulatory protein YycI n=1 Tax=Limosilactobacillus agrestimuris TaxID=2941331 RepID=UPI00204250AA|nr:two-component system regulatory protein YycI [Limosilactobacillus agrestimuris]